MLKYITRVLFAAVDKPAPPAKKKSRPNNTYGGYYSQEMGVPFDESDMRAQIEDIGYPTVTKDQVQGGGGGALLTFNRVVIDTGGNGAGGEVREGNRITGMGYGSGYFDMGLIVKRNRILRIYPMIGVGGAGGGISSRDDVSGKPTIKHYTNAAGGTFHLGIGADLRLKLWRFGVVFGIRAGYRLPIMEARDGISITGPYFRTVMGFFGT